MKDYPTCTSGAKKGFDNVTSLIRSFIYDGARTPGPSLGVPKSAESLCKIPV